MRGEEQKMKKDNGRLAPLFVGREGLGDGVEALGEETSVGLGTLPADRAVYQGEVEAHHKQEEVALA